MPSEPRNRAGYFALVRENHNFRNLWFGQIVSLFGDWFNLIASASLIGALTGSGIAIGGLFVVRMLAPFVVSPLAGVAADRYDRKKLLILADIVRAVVVLGFLLVRSPDEVWLIYVLTFVQLGMTGVFFPTRNAILPDIVSSEQLGAANAITSATWSVMLATGAAAGGLVAGGWGVRPAFVIDSLTFLVSIVFIARIRYRPRRDRTGTASLRGAVRDYLEGLSYLRHHVDIFVIALQKPALTLFVSGAYEVIQLTISKEVFVIGESGGIGLGLLYAFIGLGSGIGPILARRFTGDRDRALRVAIVFSYLAMILGLVIVASLHSFGVLLIGTLIRAIGGGTLWVFSTQLLLQLVPEHVRGRVFSTEFALLTLAAAAGAALGGWSLDQTTLGISGMLHWMAALTLVPGTLWGLWMIRGPKTESP